MTPREVCKQLASAEPVMTIELEWEQSHQSAVDFILLFDERDPETRPGSRLDALRLAVELPQPWTADTLRVAFLVSYHHRLPKLEVLSVRRLAVFTASCAARLPER